MVIIGFILFSLPGILSTSNFLAFKGHPKIPRIGGTVVATAEECLSKSLKEYADENVNVAVYLYDWFLCKAFSLPKMDFLYLSANFNIDSILEERKFEYDWFTLVPKTNLPFILWPLSKETKGKNLGRGGQAFDLSTEGSCDFFTAGPNPWKSGGSFCRVIELPQGASVPIVQNGRRFFDFSKDFTLTLWIKTYRMHYLKHQLLIGSSPIYSGRLVFFPSFYTDQLTFALSEIEEEMDTTTIDSSDKYDWRYLAVTYKAPNHVTFYRNGQEWPMLHKRMPKNRKIIPSTHIRMFKGYGGVSTFGSIAMVGILQSAVSQKELHDMMMGDF